MRLRRALLPVVVALATFAPIPARASCAPPTIDLQPAAARAGERITITGESWVDGCRDSGSCGACGGCDYGPDPVPMKGIEIRIGRETVATVDAEPNGSFSASALVPDLPPGEHQVSGAFYDGSYGLPTFTVLPDD